VLGTKIYLQRHDGVGAEGHRLTESWFPFVSFIGFIDATLSHLGYKHQPKAIQGFTSFSSSYFYDRKLDRDIDVSFLGPISDLPRRAEYIEFLKRNGVNIFVRGGRSDFLPVGEYSKLMSRSKISLSFTLNPNGCAQMKGRTLEIMGCKTMVIEDEGTETREFFDEGKDFVMARSKEDMLEKILYYLEHDDEREAIAESGYSKVSTLYTTRNYWGYVLSKIGFKLPDSFLADKHFQALSAKLESL
jgi:glycosyltransferase involved in cell wall biosynthesis